MTDPSSYHYKSRRPSQAVLTKRIREIAETRVRYGYRRIHVLLKPGGLGGQRQADLSPLSRGGPPTAQQGAEAEGLGKAVRGSISGRCGERSVGDGAEGNAKRYFMSDQLFYGRRIRILTVVDAFSRLSPAIDVRQSYRSSDVVEALDRVTGL